MCPNVDISGRSMSSLWFLESGEFAEDTSMTYLELETRFGFEGTPLNITTDAATSNPHFLYLPSFSLLPGQAYVFRVVTYQTIDPTRFKTEYLRVNAAPAPLQLRVHPATSLTITTGDQLTFTVSIPYVIDAEESLLSLTCITSTEWCSQFVDSLVISKSRPSAHSLQYLMTRDSIEPLDSDSESVRIRVGITDQGRETSIQVKLTVLAAPAPRLYVDQPEVVSNPGELTSMVVDVEPAGSGNVSIAWGVEAVLARMKGRRPEDVFRGVNPMNNPTLVVDTTGFFPGSYAFSVAATEGPISVQTDIILRINSPPSGGYLQAVPTSGYAFSDQFAMTLAQWSDSDLPLEYKFSLLHETHSGEVEELPIQDRRTASVWQGVFGPGNFTIKGTVYDALDAKAVVTQGITVELNATDVDPEDTALFLRMLDEALVSERVNELFFSMASIATLRAFVDRTDESVQSTSRRLEQQSTSAEYTSMLLSTFAQGITIIPSTAEDLGSAWQIFHSSLSSPSSIDRDGTQLSHLQLLKLLEAHETLRIPLLPQYAGSAYACVGFLTLANGDNDPMNITMTLGRKYFDAVLRQVDVVTGGGMQVPGIEATYSSIPLSVSLMVVGGRSLGGHRLTTAKGSAEFSPHLNAAENPDSDVAVALRAWDTKWMDEHLMDGFFQQFWWADDLQLLGDTVLSLAASNLISRERVAVSTKSREESVVWTVYETRPENSLCSGRNENDGEIFTTNCVADELTSVNGKYTCVCRSFSDSFGVVKSQGAVPTISLTPPSSPQPEGAVVRIPVELSSLSTSEVDLTLRLPALVCISPTNGSIEYLMSVDAGCSDPAAFEMTWDSVSARLRIPAGTDVGEAGFSVPNDNMYLGDWSLLVVGEARSSDLRFDTRGLCAEFDGTSCSRWVSNLVPPLTTLNVLENDEVGFIVDIHRASLTDEAWNESDQVSLGIELQEGVDATLTITTKTIPRAPLTFQLGDTSGAADSLVAAIESEPGSLNHVQTTKVLLRYENDNFDEDLQKAGLILMVTSEDQSYGVYSALTVNATLVDDDESEIIVRTISEGFTIEEPSIVAFSLGAEPKHAVDVKVSGDNIVFASYNFSSGSIESEFDSTISFTFQPHMWNDEVFVAVKATGSPGPRLVEITSSSVDGDFASAANFHITANKPKAVPEEDDLNSVEIVFISLGSLAVVAAIFAIIVYMKRRASSRTDVAISHANIPV